PGPFGTWHPMGEALTPDVLLVPMLAFDARGGRLGYGGGYYDRTLAELRARREVPALGFAYGGQTVDAVPHGPGDARLDGVVTEAGLLRTG
ncbi:MAG: 5-formyltetrahydrofolate cyclo-ligase, partial [Rhodobacteraceae bacterium]|nr:5-formyltetrahydrofolate cyclo-ligase [Paracoccaceae bacterium]